MLASVSTLMFVQNIHVRHVKRKGRGNTSDKCTTTARHTCCTRTSGTNASANLADRATYKARNNSKETG